MSRIGTLFIDFDINLERILDIFSVVSADQWEMNEYVILSTAPRPEANSRGSKGPFFHQKVLPKPLWIQPCFRIDFWEHFLTILGVILTHLRHQNPSKIVPKWCLFPEAFRVCPWAPFSTFPSTLFDLPRLPGENGTLRGDVGDDTLAACFPLGRGG